MKKGFTLIELLAVIVILAIITAISVPMILNVIDDSKKSAYENDVKTLIDIAILNYETNDNNPPTSYNFSDSTISSKLEGYDGDLPKSGTITLNLENDRITSVTVSSLTSKDGVWCANKNSSDENVTIDKCN